MQKNRWIICAIYAMLALSALMIVGHAAAAPAQDEEQAPRGERRRFDVGQRVERLSKELKLTDEQKTKVQALFEEQQKQGRDLRQDTSLSREEKRDKMRAMFETRDQEMVKLLTPDQKKKWDKMQKENRERMRERRENRGGQPEA